MQYPLFTEECSVLRQSKIGTNTYGKPVITWETIQNGIPCRIFQPQFAQSSSVKEIIQSNESEVIRNYTLLVPPDTDVRELDRIYHDTSDRTFEIRSVIDPGGFQHHKELNVQIIQ